MPGQTLFTDVEGVRSMLGDPMPQAPTTLDILSELELEYQYLSNELNNTGNAWMIDSVNITTSAGVYEYNLTGSGLSSIGKVLSVVTVPSDDTVDPEYQLEFAELEHLPKEWAWLSENKGAYSFSSHDGQLIVFYLKYSSLDGWYPYCQIRPVPASAQSYKIYYQVGDWWNAESSVGMDLITPFPDQRGIVRALTAKNLILTGKVKWSFDEESNLRMGKIVLDGLNQRIIRYQKTFDEYKDSFDTPDITTQLSWADENVWQ